jgi:hypothetical protein
MRRRGTGVVSDARILVDGGFVERVIGEAEAKETRATSFRISLIFSLKLVNFYRDTGPLNITFNLESEYLNRLNFSFISISENYVPHYK